MESIGEQLKAARLEQGFSIKDIVERTVISRHYVEALEQDNHAAFPADFYAASFLRQYSDTLGLASDDLVKGPLRRELEDVEEFPHRVLLAACGHGVSRATGSSSRQDSALGTWIHGRSIQCGGRWCPYGRRNYRVVVCRPTGHGCGDRPQRYGTRRTRIDC